MADNGLDFKGEQPRQIHVAYRQYGFRLTESGDQLGMDAATGSRRLKQAESAEV